MKKTPSRTILSLFHAHKTMKETLREKTKSEVFFTIDLYFQIWKSSVMLSLNMEFVCVIVLQLNYSLPRICMINMRHIILWLVTFTVIMESASIPHALLHYINGALESLLLVIIILCYMFKRSKPKSSIYCLFDHLIWPSLCQLYLVILSLHIFSWCMFHVD
jgi:hypothetical protein